MNAVVQAPPGEPEALPSSSPVAVEDLPFLKARLPLLDAIKRDLVNYKKSQDETVTLVRKWKVLTETLPQIRTSTMGCLMAIEGKNGAVTLKVVDRKKWDNLQESIKATEDDINRLENAMRALDKLGGPYLQDLHGKRANLSGVEAAQRIRLSTWANQAINRHNRVSVEEALKMDQIYQQKKQQAEAQIEHAKAEMAKLLPILERVDEIVSEALRQ